jgi:hypothetical protein
MNWSAYISTLLKVLSFVSGGVLQTRCSGDCEFPLRKEDIEAVANHESQMGSKDSKAFLV